MTVSWSLRSLVALEAFEKLWSSLDWSRRVSFSLRQTQHVSNLLANIHCAFVQTVDDVRKVTESTVLDWRRQFPKVKTVHVAGYGECASSSPSLGGR